MLDATYMSRILNGKAPKLFNAAVFEQVRKPKLLDLFCGAGGAAKGYQNLGYFVVGVDFKWQPNYCGDMFIHTEALSYLTENIEFIIDNYAAVHASPPCQAYSVRTPERDKYPRLVEPIRDIVTDAGIDYIIENVEGFYTGLINPVKLCGSSFGLRVRRHRLFETSFYVPSEKCSHEWQEEDPVFVTYNHNRWSWRGSVDVTGNGGSTGNAKAYWPWAMGMGKTWDECWMTPYELTQAIPPAYTQHVGSFIPSTTNTMVTPTHAGS